MGSHSTRLFGLVTFAAGSLALASGAALADVPLTTMQWFASSDGNPPTTFDVATEASAVTPHGNGAWQFIGSLAGDAPPNGQQWALDWDVSAKSGAGAAAGGPTDAFVTADLNVTNFTAESQIFWAIVTVALNNPILGGTFMEGSSTAGVNGFAGSPASIFNPTSGEFEDDPVYTALIDGSPVHTLFDNFFLGTPGGPVSTSTTFGDPVPEIGPDATNSISVLLKIEVSAFATASVTGTFIVEQIPAPAGLPLLAGAALFGRRRRRD